MVEYSGIMAYIWAIVGLFFLMLEMANPGFFFFIAFALSSGAISFIASISEISIISQITLFFVATVLFLILLRHFVVPYVGKNRSHEYTNVYALKGKTGFVVKEITAHSPGLVNVNGEKWIARSLTGEVLEEGAPIQIIEVKGAHSIVKRKVS